MCRFASFCLELPGCGTLLHPYRLTKVGIIELSKTIGDPQGSYHLLNRRALSARLHVPPITVLPIPIRQGGYAYS
jgi:hypothetical protein